LLNHRRVVPNTPGLPDYDSSKQSSEGVFFDFTSLYPYAMSLSVPIGGYKHLSNQEISKFRLENYGGDKGCLVKVDLECPTDLAWQRYYNELPLAPCKETVNFDQLSNYQMECLRSVTGGKYMERYISNPKLMQTFNSKTKYVCNHEELKFYTSKGLVIKKIHNVLEFKQAPIFKEFIEGIVERRGKSTSETERQFLKLLLNSLFGRMLLDVAAYLNIIVCFSMQRAITLLRRHSYLKHFHLDGNPDVSLFAMKRINVKIYQFILIGSAILCNSKVHFFKTFYDVICKEIERERINLCYVDTDSAFLHIRHRDGATDLLQELDCINSILDRTIYYNEVNAGKAGVMKSEVKGFLIAKFIGESLKKYVFNHGPFRVWGLWDCRVCLSVCVVPKLSRRF